MSAQYVLALSDLGNLPAEEVGSLGMKLARLDQRAIPLPKTLVIPHHTWKKLITEWQLEKKLHTTHHQIDWQDPAARYHAKQQVLNSISRQTLPAWLTNQLMSHYHQNIQRGFVRLLAGNDQSMDVSRFEHIQGDANLAESLLNFWLKWVEHQLDLSSSHQEIELTPTSVIVQEQTNALASGTCFTFHPQSGHKSQIVIHAIQGVPAPELVEAEADEYVVDVHTWNVIYRKVRAQTRIFSRTTDQISARPLEYAKQLEPNLSDAQCRKLAQLAAHFKQQQLHHSQLEWELTPDGFVFTGEEPIEATSSGYVSSHKCLTQLLVQAGNPHQISHIPQNADGIGLFDSQYAYFGFGIHPAQVAGTKQEEALVQKLVDTVLEFHESLPHKPIIFRGLTLGSDKLAELNLASIHEQTEPNPLLGLRGGLKYATQPQLLNLELKAITRLLQTTTMQLGLQLSFVRSPEELSHLIDIVYKAGLNNYPQFELWWQLDTPDNVLNLQAYPCHHLTGLAVDIEQLSAFLHGVDPTNSEVTERYIFDNNSATQLMKLTAEYKKQSSELSFNNQRIKLRLQLDKFNSELVAAAVNFGYDGITVPFASLELARSAVVEAEQNKIKFSNL